MSGFLKNLLNIGVRPELPVERVRTIRLLNGILLTGEIFLLLLIFKSLYNELFIEFLVQLLGVIIFAIPIAFNYFKFYRIAKLLCVLIPVFYLSFLTIFWGSERGSHLIILAVTGLAVLFFENRKIIITLCLIAALAFIITEVYNFYYEPIYASPNVHTAYLINIIITIILIVVITGMFKKEIYEYQDRINAINIEIGEQNRNMIALNKSLSASVDVIKDQKSAIDEAHKRLQDSINYAKTIQQAILFVPPELKKLIPDYFVLFQPLNVVSGDFYYIHIRNSIVFIAAVDCTGHGVPGALMSMIGHNILQEAIETEKLIAPELILNFLNEKINSSLKHSTTSNNDGMDIGLVSINIPTHEVSYAGAKNSLIVATEDEVLKFKGDRHSIGGFTPVTHNYTGHHVTLKKNDCLYLMTDGFQDQFGGPDNKKFRNTRLTGLIKNICHESMQIQHEKFMACLKAWSEGNEQTDDILLIGIRI